MKNIKFTLLSVFTVLFLFSCSSDDNGGGIDKSKILGKWYYFSHTENGIEELHDHDGFPLCGEDYLNLKSNNTLEDVMYEYYSTCHEYIDEGTYTLSGNTLTLIFEEEEEEEENFTVVCKVTTLNDTTLILEYQGDKVKLVRNLAID